MVAADDLRKVVEQEQRLQFAGFDEATAFALGIALRDRALREGLGIVADVRTWGRPLFYCALPGTSGDNPHWVRRKSNLVQRFAKSSYRMVLEKTHEGALVPPGLDPAEYVLAGGSFPIRVKSAGIIGAVTVSGLKERDDHNMVVDTLCDALGVPRLELALQ